MIDPSFLVMLNGQLMPADKASVSVHDLGFSMGVALVERMRTYRHRLLFSSQHLQRLEAGIRLLRLESQVCLEIVSNQIDTLLQENLPGVAPNQDLSVGVVVTPGTCGRKQPTVLITAEPISWGRWQQEIQNGIRLQTVNITEISNDSVPKNVKHRSRLHYFLADQEAAIRSPGSRALLLDSQQRVAESTVGTVVACHGQVMTAPPTTEILSSITLSLLDHLVQVGELGGWKLDRAPITIGSLKKAELVLWMNSTVGILEVSSIDNSQISGNQKLLSEVLNAWRSLTGVNVQEQCRQVMGSNG